MKLKIILALNAFLRSLAAYTHKLQFKYQWRKNPNPPEWFDHFIDQYYQMPKSQMSFWLERGVLNTFFIKDGAEVLELACGDGFNARNFYSGKAAKVVALDFDHTAIDHAKKYNHADNVTYALADMRNAQEMPKGTFDNIICDAAIEHLKEDEIKKLMTQIVKKLKPEGVFSGYTIIERDHVSHHLHEYEFKSKQDLENLLTPYFKHVKIIYSKAKEGGVFRENLYFFAGNSLKEISL